MICLQTWRQITRELLHTYLVSVFTHVFSSFSMAYAWCKSPSLPYLVLHQQVEQQQQQSRPLYVPSRAEQRLEASTIFVLGLSRERKCAKTQRLCSLAQVGREKMFIEQARRKENWGDDLLQVVPCCDKYYTDVYKDHHSVLLHKYTTKCSRVEDQLSTVSNISLIIADCHFPWL